MLSCQHDIGPLEALTTRAGSWRGTNTLQDPNTGRPEESPSTLNVTPVLGGRFVRLDYTWGYQGQPQEGSLPVGFDPKTGEVSGHWIDNWHIHKLHGEVHCASNMLREPLVAKWWDFSPPDTKYEETGPVKK